MKKGIFICLIGISCLTACEKEKDIFLPPDSELPGDVEEEPSQDDKPLVFLDFHPSIELVNEVTKSVTTQFNAGDEIGIFYNDTCINRKYTFDGTEWSGGQIALTSTLKNLYCYFPYDEQVAGHDNIPIRIDQQHDFLAGSAVVGTEASTAEVPMKHTLALVRVVFDKGNYSGAGHIESVIWNGIYKEATYNVMTDILTPAGEKGGYQAGGNFTVVKGQESVPVEAIVLPVASCEGITLTVVVDGEQRVYNIPEVHKWEAGKAYTYTLTLKGGYNSPIDLEEYPLDVNYWSTFGKTDKIVFSTSDKDWFDIEPGDVAYGSTLYRNEGNMLGFFGYWTGFDMNTGEMPPTWEGDFRMVLMDGSGNIVDKFQPCSITAENGGLMRNTLRRSFITAPAGTYELGVLFRKKGETTWQKATIRSNATKKDMTFTVKEQTNLPAIRMMAVEGEINTGVVNHYRPYGQSFNITYILSNRGNLPLKGEIKAVWERTFDYTGNCYRPSSKEKNGINDNEWRDEIGRVSIDLQSTVRFWNGIIPCQFPVKREYPTRANGIGYCMPMVHLYWKAEGSNEWVLLRVDADQIMAAQVSSSQEEANLFLEALNYVNIIQSHWLN